MPVKEAADRSEVDQHLAALITNSSAIRAVTEAVEGTLGPKGLDCMLVDQYGSVMVTNDGVSILKTMDVTHPAARMLISAVEQQEEQVGDGTTTAAVIAGTLIAEGVNQVIKGVPAVKVIEGIRTGIDQALEQLRQAVTKIEDLECPVLDQIALIAGRNHREIAQLVMQAARIVGGDRLSDPGFKLAEHVVALEGSESHLIQGTVINKEPLNKEMPRQVTDARILILDDALEPQQVDSDALRTEAGFHRQLQYEEEFRANLQKLVDLGVKAVFTDRAISDQAEDFLTDHGIIGVQRVALHEWRRLAEMCGARPVKRTSLAKSAPDLAHILGEAAVITVDQKYRQVRIIGKPEQNFVTLVIGASTNAVVKERERIAKDAAAAVQAAWCGGVVPGGGSVELGIVRRLSRVQLRGMTSYGYACVLEALKRPLTQITINAGFNPLEKLEEVLASPEGENGFSLGVNCETGAVEDLTKNGIWDPYYVKYFAIKSAGEVSEAVLRINTIIKMKEAELSRPGATG